MRINGPKIRELRESREPVMKQRELADLLEMEQGGVSKIEKYGDTSLDTARKIAKIFGVSLESLQMSEETDNPPENVHPLSIPAPPPAPTVTMAQAQAMLRQIHDAKESHDQAAANAWGWITGNLIMFCRGLHPEGTAFGEEEQRRKGSKKALGGG